MAHDTTDSPDAGALEQRTYWKRCSSCKTEIAFGTRYWVCSVSTCNRKRTGMVFCSVSCWEVHRPMMRHRDDYAVEQRSPSKDVWLREMREQQDEDEDESPTAVGRRRVPVAAPAPATARREDADEDVESDVLVVASKLKKYIRTRSGMNTSDGVMVALSDHMRALCNHAIRHAAQEGRKTVMDRDFPPLPDDDR
jgi:histone H3/H4